MKEYKNYLYIALIIVAVFTTIIIYRSCGKDDSVRFAEEYTSVSDDNVFVYRDIDQIINIMKKGTGVVYLGFPECPWCQAYVPYLNEVAKDVGIEKIYYYNILKDRMDNTAKYQEIVEILKDSLQTDEEGNPRVYVPNVSFHINGKLVGNDYETSKDTHDLKDPKEYWTDEEVKDLKTNLNQYMQHVYEELSTCTGCNK